MSLLNAAHLDHQSFLVKDLDAEATRLSNTLGVTFKVWSISPEICLVHGQMEPYSFKVAIAPIGTSNIEIIAPLKGNSVLKEHLEKKGEGYHHSGITFHDYNSFMNAKDNLMNKGFKPVQYGKTREAFEFGYFQLPTAGIIIELLYIDTMPQPDAVIFERVSENEIGS